MKDPEYLAKAGNDAWVLAYLAGADWQRDIDARKAEYQALARNLPRE